MKIQSTLILLFTICFVQISCGQDKLIIEKSENSRLIKVLNNSELIGENANDYLSVKIYKIDNGSGSAGLPEGHEVSYNLLIAVSEFDENPNQSVFEIGPFYNPKFVNWIQLKDYEKEIEIECGVYDKRERLNLGINFKELTVKK